MHHDFSFVGYIDWSRHCLRVMSQLLQFSLVSTLWMQWVLTAMGLVSLISKFASSSSHLHV